MKKRTGLVAIILAIQGCVLDSESRMQRRIGGYVGDKFDVYQFIDMSPERCIEERTKRVTLQQKNLPFDFTLYPWNPLNRENCGIHKVGETSKTADYEITYYGACKYIYTVDKKTDIILSWRYTKDSKNCVPGP